MIDINCDVGEGVGNEHEIMPYISSCNISCGAHAGNEKTIEKVVQLAVKHHVKIGAHPSYPDKENFGRKSMDLSPEALAKTIQDQLQFLIQIIERNQSELHHIKPHGALYNDVARDVQKATYFLDAIISYKHKILLFVPYGSVIAYEAKKRNFKVILEAFADRNYNDDLSLVSRQKNNALITNAAAVILHLKSICFNQKVIAVSGNEIPMQAATFCVHSDTKNAIEIIKEIHREFIKL